MTNAELEKIQIEITKLAAETRKLVAEAGKLSAESGKLYAEAGKMTRETFWYPVAIASVLAHTLESMSGSPISSVVTEE